MRDAIFKNTSPLKSQKKLKNEILLVNGSVLKQDESPYIDPLSKTSTIKVESSKSLEVEDLKLAMKYDFVIPMVKTSN